jgi:hypothetical protein
MDSDVGPVSETSQLIPGNFISGLAAIVTVRRFECQKIILCHYLWGDQRQHKNEQAQ